ncbi:MULTISPECIES: ornithine cyclodeaminase family protein [Streptosporangium]|uniref:Ornithine cyclodeaminase n=1 Tax=Streptosporangium brasiliense TaxID=47480 RepID=A0ABT9R3J8_9ACTN|nr:ornithine cyclodeaminase family protein [Streptosporangium brasiliense]MDP9863791.1 ornithine cyclodeaminase [Streptosporangium brasiliense]
MTLLLSRSDLERLLDVEDCLSALEQGFVAGAPAVGPQRIRTDLPGPGTATALIPGLVEGIPAYTVKVNAKFPDARPALRGVVCLHDLGSGKLLALMDSATVTAWRTGLAAALGTHALARPDAATVAVVGAGAQADLVVRGLAALRPLDRLVVADLDARRAADFAGRHAAAFRSAGCEVVPDAATAAGSAEISVLATWSREPLLGASDVGPGTHVTSLGADEPGKSELAASLLRAGRVIVDDVSLAVAMGALGNAGLTAADAAGTLAQVLRGEVPGRRGGDEVTVYAPVGLPWQDLALAWVAYRRALDGGAGLAFDFLG